MKTFIFMIKQKPARWILILGLLAGLFFSGGEGIQLLPFPVSECDSAALNVSDFEDNSKSYAFSVFSSRSFSALLKAKFQKDSNQYLSGENPSFERSESDADFCLQSAQKRQESNFLRTSPVTDSPSDRAPPAI